MGVFGARLSVRRQADRLPKVCTFPRLLLLAFASVVLIIVVIVVAAPQGGGSGAADGMDGGPKHDYSAVLQAIVQQDEGGRGIGPLLENGALASAAQTLLKAPAGRLLILTGFPCLRERTPPGETDGPPGQVALAHTLLALGREVTLLDEDHHREALQLQVAAGIPSQLQSALQLETFPVAAEWNATHDERLEAVRQSAGALLSIERAGPAADGVHYTMRGLPMGERLLGHLDRLATVRTPPLLHVAIGDGGNELGTGNVLSGVQQHIARGGQIGCVVASDALLMASVSNWGGYALAIELALKSGQAADASRFEALVQPPELVSATLRAANAGGLVDGTNQQGGGSVDGMPLAKQLEVYSRLLATARGSYSLAARAARLLA